MNWKIWLIVAGVLILVGCLLLSCVMNSIKWNFTKLATSQYETNRYEFSEAWENLSIETETANVILKPATDGKTSVVCDEQENARHAVTVKDGTLEIRLVDQRKWYEHIGLNFHSPKITLYIPQSRCGNLTVESTTGDVEVAEGFQFDRVALTLTTGDIRLQKLTAEALDLELTTGDVQLTDTNCKTLNIEGTTGKMVLKNVIAAEKLTLELSTGSIRFDGCDAGEISAQTSTGSITGSLLTPKIFYAESNTGKVTVPRTTTGGICELTTNTGSIKITLTE